MYFELEADDCVGRAQVAIGACSPFLPNTVGKDSLTDVILDIEMC